eukprot:TRINITY_DN12707_c0_g1_i2.p1 TRINITY_DN12707_c0_g1~~TRINITY_DN12707_c0_g1_i2.p1  ORF type:complete len:434 (+),score=78.60 TRINITY_DN12707_c0_g1_i2:80-1381(+)
MPVLGRQQQRKVYRLKCLAAMMLVAFAMLGIIFEMSFEIGDDGGTKVILTAEPKTQEEEEKEEKRTTVVDEVERETNSKQAAKQSVAFGPEAIGVLGKLGVSSKLPERLQKGSSLCSQCVPKSTLDVPSFCTQTESETRQANDIHFESNQRVLTDQVSIPTKYTMIYVAIGSSLHGVSGSAGGRQDYVFEAIKQWRLFNPPSECHVILVVSDEFATEAAIVSFSETHSVEIVSEKDIPLTPFYERYLQVFYIQGYMHPGGSRKTGNKDFNRLVMQRFHVLHSLIKQRRLEHVVHTENDIMVYARWADLAPPIIKCGMQLASTFASPKGVIPSVVYIKDYKAIEHMISFVNDLLSCGEKCLSKSKDNCPAGCTWTSEGSEARSGGCLPAFGISLNKALKIGTYANDMYVSFILYYYLIVFFLFHECGYPSAVTG